MKNFRKIFIGILIYCAISFSTSLVILLNNATDTRLKIEKSKYAPEKTACETNTPWTKIFYGKLFCEIK